ncbi:hypothetical protein MMC27_004888 [Xylographa pallens]|nr:hypothetical protein [Xylographa pallens]
MTLSQYRDILLRTGESQYCSAFIEDLFAQSANDSSDNSNWPTIVPPDQICSNCIIALFRNIQATPYSNYDQTLASEWASIQSQCGLSYPTAVPILQTNITQPGGFAVPGSGKTGCLSGVNYSVSSGDNCETICEKQKCATGTLIAINDLYIDCSNLYAGASICIPPQCTTYKVNSGDTCDIIANATGNTFQQLVAWNPTLGSFCTNLLAGQDICVSPPGGVQNLTTIAGATVTQTAIYATATTLRPSPVASGTTVDCGKYYEGDNCQLVALNQTISLSLFQSINPSINSACTNLELGVYYCVFPTADWNSTASSTIATAPTSTPSGTTADCYAYYTIQSGDYCGKVEDMFGISMGQLQYWNPSLLADCSSLALGEAYCVNGAEQPPAGNTPVPTTSVAGAKLRRGDVEGAFMPKRTPPPPVGGVPRGWPGLNAPRLLQGAGNIRSEF